MIVNGSARTMGMAKHVNQQLVLHLTAIHNH
jgi:hypothetical protein